MRLLAALMLLMVTGCASSPTYMGYRVTEAPFPIAGGQIVKLPVTDAGPIPAQDEKIKIEVAGFAVSLSKQDPQIAKLHWMFNFTNKSAQVVEYVLVEEVSPSEPALIVAEDRSPRLAGNSWSASTNDLAVSPQSLPWLYTPKTSVYVFRFTIKLKDEAAPHVLYQPASFSASAKASFVNSLAAMKKR